MPLSISPWIAAILLVGLWIILTGALHLDGLADCVDAIYAGHSVIQIDEKSDQLRREKILTVLKDPSAGSMAVVALILILLLKVGLVASLWPNIGTPLIFCDSTGFYISPPNPTGGSASSAYPKGCVDDESTYDT